MINRIGDTFTVFYSGFYTFLTKIGEFFEPSEHDQANNAMPTIKALCVNEDSRIIYLKIVWR
jgi:hypothetical protein